MTDEERVEDTVVADNTDYIAAIKELKNNSVSKEEYNKLKTQNKQLLDSLVAGETITQEAVKEKPTIEQLRMNLMNAKTNLDYAKASLELHNANLELGFNDYLPNGANYSPTESDKNSAERTAEMLQECIDECDGNPSVFRALMDSKVADVNIPTKR